MAKDDGDKIVGCLLGLWHLLVVSPMWLILLFTILCSLGDAIPTYAWVLFWCYVPASVLGSLLSVGARAIIEE